MSVVDDAFKLATAGFDFKKAVDRLRGAYVRRRGDFLHSRNSALSANQIATQIKAELAEVQTYLAGKDALINDTENRTAKHYDLKIGTALVTMGMLERVSPEIFFNALLKEARALRIERLPQIVWRAVAIHSDVLWKSSGPSPQLQVDALDEILDRRLCAVEQMQFTVNSFGFGKYRRDWKVQGPTGPWVDGFRGRAFEYPEVAPSLRFEPFLSQMPDWRPDVSLTPLGPITSVQYEPKVNHPPTHFRKEVDAAWEWDKDPSKPWIHFRPMSTLTPAAIIEDMMTPREDFWDRNWVYCEHVGSLVNITALGFALLRRTGNADAFNAVMNQSKYVRLGPVVGDSHDRNILMADDKDPYFENTEVAMDDLQVGDFVRFWNSRLYELLPPYGGAWGSEFSLVMGVDVDGKKGTVLRPVSGGPQVWLAGHGIHTTLYNSMASEATNYLKKRLIKPRIFLALESNDRHLDEGHAYVRWSPYETLDSAWWAEIPKDKWHDEWGYNTQDDVLKAMPRTVAKENGGTGYKPPPTDDAVYFPLYEPVLDQIDADGDSWRAYLRQRKANASFRLKSNKLQELTIDGRLAPGLFYRGSNTKIPVVRPRVRI